MISAMLCISTLCLYNRDPAQAAQRLSDDFGLVEVIAEGYIPLSKTHRMPDVALSIHAPFSDINIASANKSILQASLQEIKGTIELAQHFGAKIITIHPGRLSPQTWKSQQKAKGINLASLEHLTALAEEGDVILALENMPESPSLLGRTPEEMEDMIKPLHSKHLRMTLDVGHANTTKTLSGFINLKRYIVNIHLHDNNGTDEHLPLGKGSIDFENFFARLGNYKGNTILELEKTKGIGESKKIAERLLRQ